MQKGIFSILRRRVTEMRELIQIDLVLTDERGEEDRSAQYFAPRERAYQVFKVVREMLCSHQLEGAGEE